MKVCHLTFLKLLLENFYYCIPFILSPPGLLGGFRIIMENLIRKYNKQNSLLVVSSYPKKRETYSDGVCAVAGFTKNTILELRKTGKFKKIVVLTMIIDEEEVYEERGILIVRCFKRNQPKTYINLFKKIKLFSQVKDVLVEFEFASFGDSKATFALLPFIWSLYFSGKKITLVIHQVVLDLKMLSGHIGIRSNNLLSYIFNPALLLFYKLLAFPASSVVVLEETLKKRLSEIINEKKIQVIPHGVAPVKAPRITKRKARKLLNLSKDELVILYFGYLTWYKGVDFLVRALIGKKTLNGKKLRLIIAGGPSFTQSKKRHYRDFIIKVQDLIKKVPNNIMITGFVKETDISSYFAASDIVVLPYRAFISSSGPLSLALAFKKPFILSEALVELLNSQDIEESMRKSGIEKNDLLFKLNQMELVKKIQISTNRTQLKKLEEFSKILSSKRSFKKLAQSYVKVLAPNPVKTNRDLFSIYAALFALRPWTSKNQ